MRMRTSANDRLTVPSSVMASPVVVSPSNVLSPSTGLPERCGTRFFICVIPFPYVPFDCPTVKSSRGRELRIQARRRPQGAPVVLEKDVLVGRVRAGTGVPHAEGYVRHPSCIAHDPHRRRAAARRNEDRWPPERLLGDGGDCAYERSVGGSAIGMFALLRAELDVAKAVPVEVCTKEVRDLFRILVGHETEVDLPGRLGRYHRLRPGSVVPGLDAADVAGRLEDRGALGIVIVTAESEAFDA